MKYRGYEITSDRYQWILSSQGEPYVTDRAFLMHKVGDIVTPTPEKTYHATLRQVAGCMIERESKKCETLEEIVDLLKDALSIVENKIKSDIKKERNDE